MNKNQQLNLRIIPRFAGAPKKASTAMDFLVELVPPSPRLAKAERPPVNAAIAIDVSGSMAEKASQDEGTQRESRWEQRQKHVPGVFGPAWGDMFKNGDYIGATPVFGPSSGVPVGMQPSMNPGWPEMPALGAALPGFEWHWVPGQYVPGRVHTKMEYAIQAAHAAIDALSEQDRISVVAFNAEVHVVFASEYATSSNKMRCKAAISQLRANGGTALHAGWKKAAEQVCMNLGKNTVNRVLLLTDGQASTGVRDPKVLKTHAAGLVEHGVTTSTFGVGLSFDEDLLQAMAEGGDGRYYYLDNPSTMAERFSEEFSGMSQLFGRNVRLTVAADKGLIIERCLNDLEQTGDAYVLPNTVCGHRQQVVIRGSASGAPKDGWALTATCSWRDTDGVDRSETVTFTLPVVSSTAFKTMQEDVRVGERVAELEIALAQKEAMKALDCGDVLRSRGILNGALISASASGYSNMQDQVGKLTAFSAMAEVGDMQALRKSVTYDMYETKNSRTTK